MCKDGTGDTRYDNILEIQDTTIYSMLFADDQLLIARDYEDLEYMTRKLIDEYELWGLKLNATKTKYMAIGDTSTELQFEDRNHEPEINDRINKGQAAISKFNSIL
jgi:hypothetical protein